MSFFDISQYYYIPYRYRLTIGMIPLFYHHFTGVFPVVFILMQIYYR
nr:MAG TPA: hypothetical protein [Caudoviricetes sp.]